ncbi:MAG: ATP-binding cassette domain-containing protein [Chthoniobacterales bacterium]|nr:ATP-binding cassette domain-containing protein [Chthoniobacterales bacterium]
MELHLDQVRLPLDAFALELDLRLTLSATAVFGASGAGKTALLELLAGLRRPASGAVSLDGQVLAGSAPKKFVPPHRRRIGYVRQDGALFPHLNVRQNLRYGFNLNKAAPRCVGLEKVIEVMEIGPLLDRAIHFLSAGERQRVALARSLLAEPRLLLLDEPLASLDQPLKTRLLPYLQRIRDDFETPLVYVTHDSADIMSLCDEVVVLDRGRCIARGTPDELFITASEARYTLRVPTP